MSESSQPLPPSSSSSAISQDEQTRYQQAARDAQDARQREERDRARQEETERRERQRVEEAHRRATAHGDRVSIPTPLHDPVAHPTFATASDAVAPHQETLMDLRASRANLVQVLANHAAETRAEARAALLTVLAQRSAQRTRNQPLSPTQPLPRPLPGLTFPAAWSNGKEPRFDQDPTARMEVVEDRTAVQRAVVDASLEDHDAAAMSGGRQVRIAVAIIVIVLLLIGAMTVVFSSISP